MKGPMAIFDRALAPIRTRSGLLTRAGMLVIAPLVAIATIDIAHAEPATETRQLITDTEEKLSVEVSGWLGLGKVAAGCSTGLLPLRFTVINGGQSEAVITVRFTPGYGTTATVPWTRIVAPAGDTVRSTVYVGPGQIGTAPVGPEFFPSWMLMLNPSPGGGPRREIECRIDLNWQSITATLPAGSATPAMVSVEANRRVLSPAAFKRIFEARQGAIHLAANSEVDPATAPEDWRGWSALREFVLTDDDWSAMPTSSRRAMQEWLALGGHAVFLAADTDPGRLDRLGLPAAHADGRRRVGAGEVIPLVYDAIPRPPAAEEPPPDQVPPTAWWLSSATDLIERPGGWQDIPWSGDGLGRRAGFAERGLPVAAILSFLALLAIIAGPVNVMLLAGRGRPSRIFWTTPLISLVATGLLLGLMFLRDGVGGTGARRTLCLLDPDRNTMAVLQEQFSRTGILLGSSFPIREPSLMQPQQAAGGLNAQPGMASMQGSFVEVEDQRRSGDWFTSRSDQAFTLQTVRPGRGRIEWTGSGDAPEVLSSLDVPLARIFLLDDQGRWWKTGPLPPGERRRLEPATQTEFDIIRLDFLSGASQAVARAINRLSGQPGYAWAEAAEPGKVAIATLDAIRWSKDEAWFVGPVIRMEGR